MRSDFWPERPVEAVDTRRQRLFDDPGLGNHEPRAPAPRNVHEPECKNALEHAAIFQGGEGGLLYWATIELRSGKLLNRTTRRAGVAAGWHREPQLTVVKHGTGTPPWEHPGALIAQSAPPAAPAPTAMDTHSAEASETRPICEPDPPMAALAICKAVPSAKARTPEPGASPEINDEVIARVLGHLEVINDVRIKTEVGRIRRVLSELKANHGQARHPKYRVSTDPEKPF